MKRALRMMLCLLLAVLMCAGSVANADNNVAGTGEDSGADDLVSPRANHSYWGPLSRFFRLFDMPATLRVLLEADNAEPALLPQTTAAPASPQEATQMPPAPTQEDLAHAAEILAGVVIGLDPGHQSEADFGLEAIAPDSELKKIRQSEGCYGVRTRVPEARINLLVAQKVQALLESCGATVVMSRTSGAVSLSNIERALMMNQSGAALWLRIHCNSCADAQVSGSCMLIPSSNLTPAIYEQSLALGQCIGEAFGTAAGGFSVPLVALENQAGFNWSTIPVAAIEMGYLSNASDDAQLNSDAYLTSCAIGIFNGIVDYVSRAAFANPDPAQLGELSMQADAQPPLDTVPDLNGNGH